MSWQNKFSNLRGLAKSVTKARADEEKRRDIELQNFIKKHSIRIEKVCRIFSKSVKWRFTGSSKRGKIIFPHWVCYVSHDDTTTSKDSIRISIEYGPINYQVRVIATSYFNLIGHGESGDTYEHYNETINLSSFTEEKLSEALICGYKRLLGIESAQETSGMEMMKMRITILPKTPLGWWSVGLVVAWILCFELTEELLGTGPDYSKALTNTLSIVVTGIAVGAFVTGLISIIKRKEGSILVFLSTAAIGLVTLIGGISSLLGLVK